MKYGVAVIWHYKLDNHINMFTNLSLFPSCWVKYRTGI